MGKKGFGTSLDVGGGGVDETVLFFCNCLAEVCALKCFLDYLFERNETGWLLSGIAGKRKCIMKGWYQFSSLEKC